VRGFLGHHSVRALSFGLPFSDRAFGRKVLDRLDLCKIDCRRAFALVAVRSLQGFKQDAGSDAVAPLSCCGMRAPAGPWHWGSFRLDAVWHKSLADSGTLLFGSSLSVEQVLREVLRVLAKVIRFFNSIYTLGAERRAGAPRAGQGDPVL
jgi:hypothetical protein